MRGRAGAVLATMAVGAVGCAGATLGAAAADAASPQDQCTQVVPLAAPCTGAQKLADLLGPRERSAAVRAYRASWVHRAAELQRALQDDLPLRRAQWVGTHNSFNALANGMTLSHGDSNQQLTLTQQLDVDVRSLELDVHALPRGAGKVPVVCHGQGPENLDAGCTTEQPLTEVLPELTTWLRAHPREVVLLYIEDEVHDAAVYPRVVRELEQGLTAADGRSLILHPEPGRIGPKGCAPLPLWMSRDDIRRAGAQVLLVGSCRSGLAPVVHGWNDEHVESGDTAAYRPFPACDASYPRAVYDAKMVRYYEDSTFVRTLVAPDTPADDPDRLTPARTAAMTGCGVQLFGFDQLLPDDGRLAATVWSWAQDEPSAAGGCTVQRSDTRWERSACTRRLRAACRATGGWRVTPRPVTHREAGRACRRLRARFDAPRDGYDNALLRRAAGTDRTWLAPAGALPPVAPGR